MLIVLALLLFAAAGAAVYMVAVDGTGQVPVDSLGLTADIPVWGVFVAGAVTMLVVLAAVAAFAAGLRAARARRTEIRYLRQKVANQGLAEDRADGGPAPAGLSADDAPADEGAGRGRLGRWRRHRADEKPPAEAAR